MRHLLAASAAVSLALALPLSTQGCAESACFVYTEAELAKSNHSCPAAADALASFSDPRCPGKVVSVDGAGEYQADPSKPGEGLCCYPVTQRTVELDPSRSDCPDPNACSACSALLSLEVGSPSALCDADLAIWQQVVTCACAPGGLCAAACSSDACVGLAPGDGCVGCIDSNVTGCEDLVAGCSDTGF